MNTTIDSEKLWEAVCNRDAAADGSFFFAVRTTGVYCRPSCPARRPNRENVSFYTTLAEAEAAGFRACLRCHPKEDGSTAQRLVDAARSILEADDDETPGLEELAQRLSVSPGHLQRTFKRLTGLSPRQYAEMQRLERLKHGLRRQDVTSAVYGAGFNASSRVYEKSDRLLGMTPGTYGNHGKGLRIGYGCRQTQLGTVLLAATERGVCFLAITDSDAEAEAALQAEFGESRLEREQSAMESRLDTVEGLLMGRSASDLPALDLRGSAFQMLVWQALQAIPAGETRTYGQLAQSLGMPGAARAVGRACATNPVAVLVPCHRAVPASPTGGGYRWGQQRKSALLKAEAARAAH